MTSNTPSVPERIAKVLMFIGYGCYAIALLGALIGAWVPGQ